MIGMMNSIITKNGLVAKGSKAIVRYLSIIADTSVSANALYEPCTIYYFNDSWHIEPRSEYLMDDLDENHIAHFEVSSVFEAYTFICFEETRRNKNIFFNSQEIRFIESPSKRKPRNLYRDNTKTSVFVRSEGKYIPVYEF